MDMNRGLLGKGPPPPIVDFLSLHIMSFYTVFSIALVPKNSREKPNLVNLHRRASKSIYIEKEEKQLKRTGRRKLRNLQKRRRRAFRQKKKNTQKNKKSTKKIIIYDYEEDNLKYEEEIEAKKAWPPTRSHAQLSPTYPCAYRRYTLYIFF